MDMVAELGAKVVERELVGLPIDHHLALSHPAIDEQNTQNMV